MVLHTYATLSCGPQKNHSLFLVVLRKTTPTTPTGGVNPPIHFFGADLSRESTFLLLQLEVSTHLFIFLAQISLRVYAGHHKFVMFPRQ